jgi:hypothetical protein
MRIAARNTTLAAVALSLGACAFVPKTNLRLGEARAAHAAALSDRDVASFAPRELKLTSEALESAESAWNTLDDSAVVDHRAYLAKQRAAIAREVAHRVAAERELGAHLEKTGMAAADGSAG